jgi:hypothetical protein
VAGEALLDEERLDLPLEEPVRVEVFPDRFIRPGQRAKGHKKAEAQGTAGNDSWRVFH